MANLTGESVATQAGSAGDSGDTGGALGRGIERRSEARGYAAEAVRDGADYVVMGRQITRAADPAAEAARVTGEIAGVLVGK